MCVQYYHTLYTRIQDKQSIMSNINWIFTINNPTFEDNPQIWESVKYLIYQKEKGEQGTEHYQGYVIFNKRMSLKSCKKINARAHWEVRRGTHAQAKAYCSKEEGRIEEPVEMGEEPKQGGRTDLAEIKAKLDEGASLKAIKDEHFNSWCRYRQSFAIAKQMGQPKRDFKTQVAVIWGPTGTGKSRFVQEKSGDSIYWKSDQKWWDGYNNQDYVCLDDFYGWIKYHDMLRLLDRYPLQLETKGGQVEFNSKRIWITSNKHPREWYKDITPEKYAALERRIDVICYLGEEGEVFEKNLE